MTSSTKNIIGHLPDLKLSRIGDNTPAGLWIASLPWPRTAPQQLTLASQPTYLQALGQWPEEKTGTPRRLLLIGDGNDSAPAELNLKPKSALAPTLNTPNAEMILFESSPHPEYIWERHFLKLSHGENSVGLAMGLRTGDEVHWWEACRLVVLESTEECLVVEMGGAIPHEIMPYEALYQYSGVTNPFLHKHKWLNGHIYARLFANGVCEIYAHHVNSRFMDDGLDLKDAVPVIGFVADTTNVKEGDWDGSITQLDLGNVQVDISEASSLATPEKPGSLKKDGPFLVWQAYEGMELFGGICPVQLLGDPYIYRSSAHIIPRGMARTLRFSLSLSNRSPRIARYVAPAWWYGLCEEFSPEALLPVSNEYDETTNIATEWIKENIKKEGFETGSIPRHTMPLNHPEAVGEYEPGWEGEIPYAAFLQAWRTGDHETYQAALNSAYYIADVAVDHASNCMHMHGYPPPASSVPMNRMQGAIAAYLETGDPYLLETSQAVTANSHWTNRNSWPRLGVGRDACYVRSAVLLYRYFSDDFFRKIAYEGAIMVVESQRPNGSFGDQGGGTGIHQWGGYITKPWMGLLALSGVLDYLELFPEETKLLGSVERFANWLMEERFDHDGIVTWSYQHDFNGGRNYYDPTSGSHRVLPGEGKWHQESLGRLLTYCTLRFNRPDYMAAWMESRKVPLEKNDHGVAAALQFVPWVQDRLWRARLDSEGLTLTPLQVGELTPNNAVILGPFGEKHVQLQNNDQECFGLTHEQLSMLTKQIHPETPVLV